MATMSEERFLQSYGNFLVQAWSQAELKNRFKANPAAVLKEFGLDAGGATINILAPGQVTAASTKESQVALWNDGVNTGKIDFYFPETPPEGMPGELSDSDLEAVAGGWSISCCSCTPCCCC